MAHQDYRSARNHHLQNGFQVPAQLLHAVGVDRGLGGLPVPTLVVEHHPDLVTPALRQRGTLKMKRPHAQAESVREHHRQWRGHRTDLPHHQRGAVLGGDDAATVGVEKGEVLALVGVFDEPVLPQCLRGRYSGDRAESGHAGHQSGPPADTEDGIAPRLAIGLIRHRNRSRHSCAAPGRADW